MNQLSLDSFLGGHDKDGLRGTGSETAHKIVKLAFLGQHASLHECVCTESDVVLGHGEEEESSVSTVEAKQTALTPSLFNSSNHT